MDSIKFSRAISHINWLIEKTDVSGTISVPVITVLIRFYSVMSKHLPEGTEEDNKNFTPDTQSQVKI